MYRRAQQTSSGVDEKISEVPAVEGRADYISIFP
jgi:hypothetical protein